MDYNNFGKRKFYSNKENHGQKADFLLPTYGLNKRAKTLRTPVPYTSRGTPSSEWPMMPQEEAGNTYSYPSTRNSNYYQPPLESNYHQQSSARHPPSTAQMQFMPKNNTSSFGGHSSNHTEFGSPYQQQPPRQPTGTFHPRPDFEFCPEDPPRRYPSTVLLRPTPPRPPPPTTAIPRSIIPNIYQRRDNNMRLFCGNVQKALYWSKLSVAHNILFEVTGMVDNIHDGFLPSEKLFVMRDTVAGPALTVVFYEIDRELPHLEPGSLVKVVGAMKSRSRLQAFQILASSEEENAANQHVVFLCDRTAHELHKTGC